LFKHNTDSIFATVTHTTTDPRIAILSPVTVVAVVIGKVVRSVEILFLYRNITFRGFIRIVNVLVHPL
jgi:hypothetical protein